MEKYTWIVWRDCKIEGRVEAYSAWEAVAKAAEQFGRSVWIEREQSAKIATSTT